MMYIPGNVFCNIAIYTGNTTLSYKWDQTSDLWQWLKLASELESEFTDFVDLGRTWLTNFNAGKTWPVSFDHYLHDFSVTISWCYKDVYINIFSPCAVKICSFPLVECFPLTYDLNCFKSKVNRHFLYSSLFFIFLL